MLGVISVAMKYGCGFGVVYLAAPLRENLNRVRRSGAGKRWRPDWE